MNKPDFEPLVRDLVTDARFGPFRAGLKSRALAKVRFRRRMKAGARVVVFVLAIGGAALLVRLQQQPTRTPLQASALPSPPQPVASMQPPAQLASPVPEMSDEELLGSFPPGSCELIEVNGEKRLLFADQSLWKQVMR